MTDDPVGNADGIGGVEGGDRTQGDIDDLTGRIAQSNRKHHRHLVVAVIVALLVGVAGGFLGGTAAASRNTSRSASRITPPAIAGVRGSGPNALRGGTGGFAGVPPVQCPSEVVRPLPSGRGTAVQIPASVQASVPVTAVVKRLFIRNTSGGIAVRVYERSAAQQTLCSSGGGGVAGSGTAAPPGQPSAVGGATGARTQSSHVCTIKLGCGNCTPGVSHGGTVPVRGYSVPGAYAGTVTIELSDAASVAEGFMTLSSLRAAGSASRVIAMVSGSFGFSEGSPTSWVAVQVSGNVASVRVRFAGGATDQMKPVGGVAVLAGAVAGGGQGSSEVRGTVQLLDPSGKVVATQSIASSVTPGLYSGPTTLPVVLCPQAIPAPQSTGTG